jgi:hypothetical protein
LERGTAGEIIQAIIALDDMRRRRCNAALLIEILESNHRDKLEQVRGGLNFAAERAGLWKKSASHRR